MSARVLLYAHCISPSSNIADVSACCLHHYSDHMGFGKLFLSIKKKSSDARILSSVYSYSFVYLFLITPVTYTVSGGGTLKSVSSVPSDPSIRVISYPVRTIRCVFT